MDHDFDGLAMIFSRYFAIVAAAALLAVWTATPGRAQLAPRPPADVPVTQSQVAEPQAAPAGELQTPAIAESTAPPTVEPAVGVTVTWEVKNRFRLFRDEGDFRRQVDALRGHTVLESEQALAEATEGRGWAADMLARLCLDNVGQVADQCLRDGARENYLNPADHRVGVQLAGQVPAGATCAWTFTDPDGATQSAAADCAAEVIARPHYSKLTVATVDITAPGDVVRRATAEIQVRDFLIAGLGDSIGSGDGNPDRPVTLSDDGFCFRRFLPTGKAEYFRPGRVDFAGDKACDGTRGDGDRAAWAQLSARWLNAACHRSLYGYQLRAALALAVETPHAAVTFLPLACTGATIDVGLFAAQPSREINCGPAGGAACPATTPAQLMQLRALVARAQRARPNRALDLVFLTIGANDIGFSGLIADIIIQARAERALFSRAGIISSVAASQAILEKKLPADFGKLRTALKPLVGNVLERVVFTSYGHPALAPEGGPCPGGRDGFDVHPAFGVDADRMRQAAAYVQDKFLPTLKDIVTCAAKGACADPKDSMTFVDAHQAAFAEHGFCARAETDPAFDRDCFSTEGKTFNDSLVEGATDPLACNRSVDEFRAYASRARWIRTANDSYFAAMTFPEGVAPSLQPSDLHDATWGVLSAVYGGAIHPTAEGHAAMADAALAAARGVLQISAPRDPIIGEPLPPLSAEPQ